MIEEKPAVNTTSAAAPEKPVVVDGTDNDYETKISALEAENAQLIEESANYKLAFLKEKSKNGSDFQESDEDKMRRIATETIANSRLVEIAKEKDALIKKALKENKELKLAQLNKTTTPSSVGVHSEGRAVTDTLVTNEQIEAFKKRGWTDKDIERYKKNLLKYLGR